MENYKTLFKNNKECINKCSFIGRQHCEDIDSSQTYLLESQQFHIKIPTSYFLSFFFSGQGVCNRQADSKTSIEGQKAKMLSQQNKGEGLTASWSQDSQSDSDEKSVALAQEQTNRPEQESRNRATQIFEYLKCDRDVSAAH